MGASSWESLPIIDMLIHRIITLSYEGVDLAKEFGGKSKEKQITDKMKREFGLVEKSHGYSMCSITDGVV